MCNTTAKRGLLLLSSIILSLDSTRVALLYSQSKWALLILHWALVQPSPPTYPFRWMSFAFRYRLMGSQNNLLCFLKGSRKLMQPQQINHKNIAALKSWSCLTKYEPCVPCVPALNGVVLHFRLAVGQTGNKQPHLLVLWEIWGKLFFLN